MSIRRSRLLPRQASSPFLPSTPPHPLHSEWSIQSCFSPARMECWLFLGCIVLLCSSSAWLLGKAILTLPGGASSAGSEVPLRCYELHIDMIDMLWQFGKGHQWSNGSMFFLVSIQGPNISCKAWFRIKSVQCTAIVCNYFQTHRPQTFLDSGPGGTRRPDETLSKYHTCHTLSVLVSP